ncbi:SDR family oxidoreductase [Sulfitobacter mediterraneus]|uniref:SDR family oxidoreductase n=1 Tax=Sulfitobacter mediterraneus TaxID=83219 RepID=UPI001939C5E8|nr:SDR family oxidoreductase [Sulfitobacter mediterraneus]MBM1557342.1 SDR family oxidoreductase [Sulfitobacter mediterraneus]MBM1568388.1 SDR family oxidoreductase [Sulfitobacter mediterraneus]MBM1572009.1 SDR family oxidoreductase [Sulfitobacter mediterraneus]MBM1575798.1 SDR family oxidoreductase [Sulfitobacter mediterraneus]MBM1580120.1 SDR family oxidoreductase [Sulfitobacter mediterraneus]
MRPVCLITGASAGIGAACALLAANRGYDLALTYNSDPKGAEDIADQARAAGAKVLVLQLDVADPDAIDAMYRAVDDHFGRLDALINNAGIVAPAERLTGMDHARLRQIFDVNVIGAMLVAKGAVTRMEPAGSGVIVNISSAAARLGSANQYLDYAASKGAIDTFTKGLSDEVAPSGIRVMAVAPGLIETDIHMKGGQPDRAARLGCGTPLGRAGSAEEVANAVIWLLGDEASYVTGSVLDVTGGR